MRITLAAIAMAIACGAPADSTPKRIDNVAPGERPSRTCALATPQRTPVQLTYREYLGRIGDRTWVLGERGDRVVLVTLDDAGALATTPLPIESDRMTTLALPEDRAGKPRLWLVTDTQGLGMHDQELLPLDFDGARVVVGAVESLAKSPLPGVSSFGLSSRYALFFTFAAGAGFQLWDRQRASAIGPAVPLKTSEQEPPAIRCAGEACFAVAVPGDGPTRRISVLRFDPRTGAPRTEALANDHLSDHRVIPVGDRTLVLWTSFDRRGIFARELDASGHPVGPERTLVAGGSDPQLVGGDPLTIAYQDGEPWRLAKVSADRTTVEPGVSIGLDEYLFVLSATTVDGTLSVGISSSTDYDGSIHSWTAHGDAVWTGARAATADPPLRLWERKGGGHGGFAGFPLVTPRHAAVLAVSSSDETGGELVLLREPCR